MKTIICCVMELQKFTDEGMSGMSRSSLLPAENKTKEKK